MSYWYLGELAWHVRREYYALLLYDDAWILRWEFDDAPPGWRHPSDPEEDIGDRRTEPIDEDEAIAWVAAHWTQAALARTEQRWKKRLDRVEDRFGERGRRRFGFGERGRPEPKSRQGRRPDIVSTRENVHRAVMVAFLEYAGMFPTRHASSNTRPSACDVVAARTVTASTTRGVGGAVNSYQYVANKVWGTYKRHMPFHGNRPSPVSLSYEQAALWELLDVNTDGPKTGIRQDLWPAGDDSERRREWNRWIHPPLRRDYFDDLINCPPTDRRLPSRLASFKRGTPIPPPNPNPPRQGRYRRP